MNHTRRTNRLTTIVAPMMLLLAVPAARAVSVAGDEPARPQVHLEMTILQLDLEAIEARDASADAQEITYIYTLVEAGDLTLGVPRQLFEYPDLFEYDVAPGGQRFVLRTVNPDAMAREIRVVLNWFEELKAKVGNE